MSSVKQKLKGEAKRAKGFKKGLEFIRELYDSSNVVRKNNLTSSNFY